MYNFFSQPMNDFIFVDDNTWVPCFSQGLPMLDDSDEMTPLKYASYDGKFGSYCCYQ